MSIVIFVVTLRVEADIFEPEFGSASQVLKAILLAIAVRR